MCKEKSQVSKALIHSCHAEASSSRTHPSPSSSSRMRRVSPTGALLPSSSRRQQFSPIQALEVSESLVVHETPVPPPTDDAFELVSPLALEVTKSVPPTNGEVVMDDESGPPRHLDEAL